MFEFLNVYIPNSGTSISAITNAAFSQTPISGGDARNELWELLA